MTGKVHFYTFVIGILMVVVFVFLHLLPSIITVTWKPLVILMLLLFMFAGIKLKMDIAHLCLIGLISIFSLVTVMYGNSNLGLIEWISNCIFILLFIMCTILPFNKKDIDMLFHSCIVGTCFFTLICAFSNPLFQSLDSRTVVPLLWTAINANELGIFAAFGFFLAFSKLLYKKKRDSRIRYFLFCIILVYGIWLSGSRTAVVTVFGSMSVLIYYKYKLIIKKFTIESRTVIKLILVGMPFILLFIIPIEKLGRAFAISTYTNSNGRFELWKEGIRLWLKKPILGGGFDYWFDESAHSLALHNMYINLLVISGIIGCLLMIAFLIRSIQKGWKTKILLSFIVFPVLYSLVETGMDYVFWFSMILFWTSINLVKREQINPRMIFE